MMNKSMIMTRAWAIAKGASKKFGYSAKEYFAISLRMAWAEAKEVKAMQAEKKEPFATLPEIEAVSDKQRKYAEDIRKAYLEKVKSALTEVKATSERAIDGDMVMDGFWESKFWGLFKTFGREMSDWSSNKELFKFEIAIRFREAIQDLYDVDKKYSSVEEYNAYCKEVTEKAVEITLEAFEKFVTASTKAKAWINEYKYVLYK